MPTLTRDELTERVDRGLEALVTSIRVTERTEREPCGFTPAHLPPRHEKRDAKAHAGRAQRREPLRYRRRLTRWRRVALLLAAWRSAAVVPQLRQPPPLHP